MIPTNIIITIEFISSIISLICLPINICFVYIIFIERHRPPYNTPFFRLCIHLSVADILMEVFVTIFFKCSVFGYCLNRPLMNTPIPIAGMQYLGHAQAIGIIFIAANRFTAVYFPIKHRQSWWTSKTTTYILLFQWIFPLFFWIPLKFLTFEEKHVDDKTHNLEDNYPRLTKQYHLIISVADGIFINLIVLILYGAIFLRVHTHVVVRKPGELALRLALSAFIIFVCYLFSGIFNLLCAFTTDANNELFYHTMWFVVNDILCNSSALVLLALNRPIRKAFVRHFRCSSKFRVSTKNNSLLQQI
ncbi:unnamed protein product [Caenorhabditis angaria]|uniref:G-protein coupled receptors family 1 profile domain-containing protein n=1 Tax=Caenorhabditis angaria TaxID=860376 RepID=A0A9P1MZP8_9PELO|nr:unnamed protein product [Caenorhabditis angaria]